MNATRLSTLVCAGAFALANNTVSATEGGGTTYPLGVLTTYSGYLLPPGNHLQMYNQFVALGGFVGNSGNKVLDSKVRAYGTSIRYLHVFQDLTVAGGNVAFELDPVFVAGNFKAPELGIDSSKAAMSDTTFGPSIGWHGSTLHQIVSLLVTAPTGAYDKSRAFNPGRNVFGLTAHYAITWLPSRNWELTAQFVGIWNSKNTATDYQSGSLIDVDYGLNYHFDSGWYAGVGGYAVRQLSDDKQGGATVNGNGNRLRTFAIGPQLGYGTQKAGGYLSWQNQVYARNTSKGNVVWLNLYYNL